MGDYSGFKLYNYFNACACALRGLLLSAFLRSASHNSVNTHQNENRFLAFGSPTSSAEVQFCRKCTDFCFYFILYSETQCISKLDKIGIFIDMKFH